MTDDIHSLAREIEALDEAIADANADKAEVFRRAKKILREDLPAFREALAQRRKRDKNPAAYEELKGRAAELLEALDTGLVLEHARAPARTRTTDLRSPEHRAAVAANQTDRASNARRAPEGGGEGVSSSPEPITESSEGAATSPHRAAAGTLSLPTPSLDPEYAADAARNYTEAVGSIRAGIVERGEARLHTRLPSMDEALVDFDPVRDLPPWCDKRRAPAGEVPS